ncbi:hypothetical protein; putative exported protein [Xenorhabdus nematophila ATCC 19061]|uniref:Uncharacterized protein n=1 Tax=Xenorhabdus nematophila (strain ATCC 19061 / DSM 3370 / CCUG 14189 / LMG 1036 / NCIMB 9965 / AN6) TaxID=406817 RepID=D3VEL9_XENNA|nr:hypothetical protein; putative exported protein [Xenorhabdus nematophila ATCC 19061]
MRSSITTPSKLRKISMTMFLLFFSQQKIYQGSHLKFLAGFYFIPVYFNDVAWLDKLYYHHATIWNSLGVLSFRIKIDWIKLIYFSLFLDKQWQFVPPILHY